MVKYLVNFELNIEKIKNIQLPYNTKSMLYERIHAEDIQALSEITNDNLGYAKALNLQRGKEDLSQTSKYKIYGNYRSTQDFIKSYSSTKFIPVSAELMCHLNKLLLSNIVEPWEIGKFRDFSEIPNEIYDSWYSLRDFYPKKDMNKHFNLIFKWIINNPGNYHRLIQSSLLLYEFIDNAPFHAGNQLTSYLTLTCVLKEFGYDDENTFCIAKALNTIDKEIPKAFKISKSKRDQTLFTEAILYAISLESIKLKSLYEEIYESNVKNKQSSVTNLNDRQIKALEYLKSNKSINRSKYTQLMGVSFMTAYRDLSDLLSANYIELKGQNKNTFYVLKTQEEIVKKPVLQVIKDSEYN